MVFPTNKVYLDNKTAGNPLITHIIMSHPALFRWRECTSYNILIFWVALLAVYLEFFLQVFFRYVLGYLMYSCYVSLTGPVDRKILSLYLVEQEVQAKMPGYPTRCLHKMKCAVWWLPHITCKQTTNIPNVGLHQRRNI